MHSPVIGGEPLFLAAPGRSLQQLMYQRKDSVKNKDESRVLPQARA
jgi:hypothetical protein